MWEDKDKDRKMERFVKQPPPLPKLVASMEEFRRSQEEVLQEDTTQTLAFLRFDLSPLKQAIVKHCDEWITRYTGLLHRMARKELDEIQSYLRDNTEALRKFPSTLDELSHAVRLHTRVTGDRERGIPAEKDTILAKMGPLHSKYEELKNQGVAVPDEEQAELLALADTWEAFEGMLRGAEDMLVRAKESQRDRLVSMVDQFVVDLGVFRQEFESQAPFSSDGYELEEGVLDVAKALQYVKDKGEELNEMKRKSESLKAGMDIFNIPEPPYKELGASQKDLQMLSEIWGVARQWQAAFDSWKHTMFRAINVDEMEEAAVRISKSIVKLGREIKDWPVWSRIKVSWGNAVDFAWTHQWRRCAHALPPAALLWCCCTCLPCAPAEHDRLVQEDHAAYYGFKEPGNETKALGAADGTRWGPLRPWERVAGQHHAPGAAPPLRVHFGAVNQRL